MRPVEVRNGYFKAHCLVAELDASVLQHASGRQPQAWTKATQLCKQAVRERIIIAKALKVTAAAACSGAAPLLEFRQIAKSRTERQPRIFHAHTSDDDHLTRPETLSGNAMWKKLTTTPWRTEDARSDLRRRDVSHTAGTSEPPRR